MPKFEALIEVDLEVNEALSRFTAAGASFAAGRRQIEEVLPAGVLGAITFRPTAKPIPMFAPPPGAPAASRVSDLQAFASPVTNPDLASVTQVLPVQADAAAIDELRARPGVRVWPNSAIRLLTDCAPFQPGVTVDVIRDRLGVAKVWEAGYTGDGVVVGIIDEGIDGTVYPVIGGFNRAGGQEPGAAAIDSHGSMCAADVAVAAPEAKLYDYPFLVQRSSSALAMFNAVLEQRRQDGTPHVVSNSWGFYAVPPQKGNEHHEIWDLNHPLHRKIREVVASRAPVLFAAGNCGLPSPAGNCDPSSTGPDQSIHGSNSLEEVITVAAVNSTDARIGYSSQGRGMFAEEKPDVAAYSHFFGNFGPGRPGGDDTPFDNGTSAACPVAAGVVALLVSAEPTATPSRLRDAVIAGAGNGDWSPDIGRGVINAAGSVADLRSTPAT